MTHLFNIVLKLLPKAMRKIVCNINCKVNINKIKTNSPAEIWTNDMNRRFTKEIHIVTPKGICSTTFTVKEMQN